MADPSTWPALDAEGRTPRQQGKPLGATRCGCLLVTDWRLTQQGWQCQGCGSLFGSAEHERRIAARQQAGRCKNAEHRARIAGMDC